MFLFSGSTEPWFLRKLGHEKILCTLGSFSLQGNRQKMHLHGGTIKKNAAFGTRIAWEDIALTA